MQICNAPFLLCTLLFLSSFSILFPTPLTFSSALQLSDHRHAHHGNASDEEALLGFLSGITYDPWQSLTTTWKPNVSFCGWRGVICSRRRQRVVSLDVSSLELQGTISPLLGNLSFLRILDLANNSFQGHIPYQLGNLFRLKELELYMNQLHGSIPLTLGRCRSLQIFSMDSNELVGNIPSEIMCNLPKLQFLGLWQNNLTGRIPSCSRNISTTFTGEVYLPESPPSASVILLSFNHLTGEIPSSFSNFTNLRVLDIGQNLLTGHVPVDLCRRNMPLTMLVLSGNQLSGSIPASLINCTNLQTLDFSYNQLRGIVPMELGKLTQLQVLYLDTNQLVSGSTTNLPILTMLTNCSTLRELDLSYNHLTGRLPFSIGSLSKGLDSLNVGTNALVGEIPPQIGNLTRLTFLCLQYNFFTGAIPSSLKMLQRLERLYMNGNNLQGTIPTEIGQLKTLGLIDISENNLSGRIPDSITSLQQLRYLDLHMNQLSDRIPKNVGKCVNFLMLDLSYNKLSGEIPLTIASLANLALYFNLSNNLLEGRLPLELRKMDMLQAIDISANRLIGNIPSGLASCKELEYLNLSWNALEGMIPVSFGELQSLQDMDFSSNNLSGGIPTTLANLKMLSRLNFSFNNLSGEVPKGGVFKKIGATAFMVNPSLCGPRVNLSLCPTHRHKILSHMKKVVISIVAIVVTIVLCLVIGILCRLYHKRNIPIEVGASLNVGHRRISYGELITATNGFSDANLLGVGTFGTVYKGVLNDGMMVAIKIFNLENEGANKSFVKECKVLGAIKHRNVIRVVTSYSNLQMKALIFPFMPNGSLEKWLYSDGEVESGLTLIQRLNIAIDIAQGMVYLHHHCFMQVIHCDLKPNNVLLGEDMTAYVIDFGVATICLANDEDSTFTSTLALKGSVGYIPPEYGLGGHVTTKGDVYSYGIVLLEMLTGKKPTHTMFVEGMNLQKWVGNHFPNQLGEVVDKSLLRGASASTQADKDLRCLNQSLSMGLLCTRDSPEGRPTMMDIVGTLQSIRDNFQGIGDIPKPQSDFTCLLGDASTTHNNNASGGQSSSTF